MLWDPFKTAASHSSARGRLNLVAAVAHVRLATEPLLPLSCGSEVFPSSFRDPQVRASRLLYARASKGRAPYQPHGAPFLLPLPPRGPLLSPRYLGL